MPSPIPFIPVSCRDWLNLPEALVLPTPPDFLSTTLYMALRRVLLDDMFDPETFQLKEKYSGMDGAVALQNRFKVAAVVTLGGSTGVNSPDEKLRLRRGGVRPNLPREEPPSAASDASVLLWGSSLLWR